MSSPELTPDALQSWFDASPFIAFMNLKIEAVDAEAGSLTVSMPIRPEFERGGPMQGQFHGGPVASLIDTVGDFAVALKVGGGVPTINFRVDYLRPSSGTALTATATARRVGRSVAVVDIDVYDDRGRLTAIGRGTYGSQVG